MYYDWFKCEKGTLALVADDRGLHHIEFQDGARPLTIQPDWNHGSHPVLDATRAQLKAYFGGELSQFDLPVAMGGTEFQRQVWKQLMAIPLGQTISYSELARRVEKPKAVRAVGAANGQNPVAIVVPCHRVIGKSGKLTGYAGGLSIKSWLLELEAATPSS